MSFLPARTAAPFRSFLAATTIRKMGSLNAPLPINERMTDFSPKSLERNLLINALEELNDQITTGKPLDIPVIINDSAHYTGDIVPQRVPHNHAKILSNTHQATPDLINDAIEGAMKAQHDWMHLPPRERQAVFLKAADLLANQYRYKMLASVMLGQGKTCHQADIDSVCELADFWRFNVHYSDLVYASQPTIHANGVWNNYKYRPLEGFVYAISPFNFTAIGGNLPSAPALMGNVCLWKPAPNAMHSNYLVYQILREAGLPEGVIQFVPGNPVLVSDACLQDKNFAGLHYTGSTQVFKSLQKTISARDYNSFPRIVAETGGKNMHFVHPDILSGINGLASDDHMNSNKRALLNVVNQTIRGAFEYQGQKCSATSRLYVPESVWAELEPLLLHEIANIKVGPTDDLANFVSAVINKAAFDKHRDAIAKVNQSDDAEILAGGITDDAKGYFVHPTLIKTTSPDFFTLKAELFGPILTAYVYPDAEAEQVCKKASEDTQYALTASLFATDRKNIDKFSRIMLNAAGNIYINDKSTGAVVGQQAFGGGRMSGTNDKSGSLLNLYRWVQAQAIKENLVPLESWKYPFLS